MWNNYLECSFFSKDYDFWKLDYTKCAQLRTFCFNNLSYGLKVQSLHFFCFEFACRYKNM